MDPLIESAITQDLNNISSSDRADDLFEETTDAQLRKFVDERNAKIKVVGVGGGGNNTVTRIAEVGIIGVETIAVNTDAQDLLYTTASKKILIGKETCNGLGAGSDPKVGEAAAKEQEAEIRKAI